MILGYPHNSNTEAWMVKCILILFIYDLFKYTVSTSEYIVSDGKIILYIKMNVCLFVCMELTQIHISEPI